jgi:putative endonuclease
VNEPVTPDWVLYNDHHARSFLSTPKSNPIESNRTKQSLLRPASPTPPVHYVYVVECADGSYYTGYTTDVERRVAEHNAGDGAKYTRPRSRRPVELLHRERYETKSNAMAREYEIKQLTRRGKERLVGTSG